MILETILALHKEGTSEHLLGKTTLSDAIKLIPAGLSPSTLDRRALGCVLQHKTLQNRRTSM